MKLTGLADLLTQLAPIASLRGETGNTRAYGILQAARPAVMAALTPKGSGPVLVIAAHPNTARDLATELAAWTNHEVALFPAVETLPYERVRVDRAVLAEREAVTRRISEAPDMFVIAAARALLQPIQPVGERSEPSVVVHGEELSVPRLLQHWVDGGYAETNLVEEAGTFARRGGVLDIFPIGEPLPVRIELFGNEVESLRTFDPDTQRSSSSIDFIAVSPIAALNQSNRLAALESLLDVDTTEMNAEARTSWLDDLARLEAGASLDELAVFAPYLIPPVSLVEQMSPASTVLVDNAGETVSAMEDLWRQGVDVQRSLEASGNLPVGLRHALLEPDRLRRHISSHRVIEFLPGSSDTDGGHDLSELFTPAPQFAGRLRTFLLDIKSSAARRTVIASQQAARIEEMLHEEAIGSELLEEVIAPPGEGVCIVHGSVPEGWRLGGGDTVLLSDHEIFGHARIRNVPRRRPARESFFSDFSPGDYVVHLEHGIGRFDSVTRMAIDEVEREYALIQFAGADRVYVPTDQLERLTRYIGVGESPPHLSKLGGGEWQRARHRAKRAAEDIARELIDLYAKRSARPGYAYGPDSPWQRELEASFPYPETPDQTRAIEEVKADMEEPRPMDRLVCADVGYGKTEVAVRAAFKALMEGKQVAVLVPTTILAQQHFETFSERLAAFPAKVEALSRFRSPAQQKDILRRTASGEVDVVIGTHRLLQKDVRFKNLGLLVIDEEQRFGVKHKERLKQLRETIDVLTLTATPIPRTLHMTLVGIREVSIIDTAPEGRLPIKTYLQPFDDRLVREAVVRELDRDGQVYIVHNKVATIEAMAEKIRRLVPEARVLVGHGQMEESQLERAMLSFAHQQSDVLVCSTIIENGLDIPNVNTILVNNAHTLGLTQLYQLRGRVGRSANQAYAYLLYPKDVRLSHDAARRLEAVFEARELGAGFNVAMKDLEIRGAGNLLGAEQSGSATAIGFDLYTRMVADAVERLRGIPVQELPTVTIDLPLTMFLPADYIGNESERLTLYRRLALVTETVELVALTDEIRDRFGALPNPVQNLVTSIRIKIAAAAAHINTVRLDRDVLVMKTVASGLYDRVSLYRKYGTDARITNNMLRIPRARLGGDWVAEVSEILLEASRMRESIGRPQPVGA